MNEDLELNVDGEPPLDAFRDLSTALRCLPEPEVVGRAETLAVLRRRPAPLWRIWGPSLAACAAVLAVVSGIARVETRGPVMPIVRDGEAVAGRAEVAIPAVRREAFVRFVHGLGGQVRRDGDGLRAFYPQAAHEAVKRRFLLPDDIAWPTDGLRVRLAR